MSLNLIRVCIVQLYIMYKKKLKQNERRWWMCSAGKIGIAFSLCYSFSAVVVVLLLYMYKKLILFVIRLGRLFCFVFFFVGWQACELFFFLVVCLFYLKIRQSFFIISDLQCRSKGGMGKEEWRVSEEEDTKIRRRQRKRIIRQSKGTKISWFVLDMRQVA